MNDDNESAALYESTSPPRAANAAAAPAEKNFASHPAQFQRNSSAGVRTATVVINTYNRATYLPNAIRSVANQSYPAVELVVVNGPSTDRTERVLESEQRGGLTLKVANCKNRNLSESRNIGISQAAGDVVFFMDDDAVAHPDWITQLITAYVDPAVGAAGGFTVDHTGVTFQCQYTVCDRYGNAKFFKALDPTRILEGLRSFSFPSLLGTNCSFRRKDLLSIGGFDETFAYFLDETDVCLRLFKRQRRIVTVPQALVFHKYAPSDLRTAERTPNSLFAPAKSKAHFIIKHSPTDSGAEHPALAAAGELERYSQELQFSNRWHLDHKKISTEHYLQLDGDLHRGLAEGIQSGLASVLSSKSALNPTSNLDKGTSFVPLVGQFHAERIQSRLRIYFVSQGYPPHDTSGIARWTHECARALTARGHEIHVVTRSTTANFVDHVEGIWIHGVVDAFPDDVTLPAPIEIPDSLARRAAAVYAEIKRSADIWGVSVVSAPIWDLEGLFCVKYLRKPVVTSLHTTYLLALPSKPDWLERPQYRRNHVDKVIAGERWLLRHSPRILANSNEVVRSIDASYGLTLADHDKRLHMIPHGLADLEEAYTHEPKRSTLQDAVSVLFVGRIERRKGLDQLLNALLRIAPCSQQLTVNIVGSWPSETDSYAMQVKSAAKELAMRRKDIKVNFVGHTDDRSLLQYYSGADIFVAPSRFESFGLILVEAMRAGCPVIASDIGGMREVVDDRTGFLAKVDDIQTLASHLDKLIRDKNLRFELGNAGRRKFETTFTAQTMAANLENYFRTLVQAEVAS